MLKLLLNVRRAYLQWKGLPPEDRDRYAQDIRRIRELVVELGGSRALHFVDHDSDGPAEPTGPEALATGVGDELDSADRTPAGGREREEIIAELQTETMSLLGGMATPVSQLASDSMPRSVKLSGRLVSAGIRRRAAARDAAS